MLTDLVWVERMASRASSKLLLLLSEEEEEEVGLCMSRSKFHSLMQESKIKMMMMMCGYNEYNL